MNPIVHERATRLAQVLSQEKDESRLGKFTYTGRVLEKDHVTAPELTRKANLFLQTFLSPILAIERVIELIDNDPYFGSYMDKLMKPAIDIMCSLGFTLASLEEKSRSRRQHSEWENMLSLNQRFQQNQTEFRIIDRQGNIL